MKQALLQERYPLFSLDIEKSETDYESVKEVIAYLKSLIDEHKVAKFIAIFDHYKHTKNLEDGQISEDILDGQNIIFCFGITLPEPQVMAVRPRSIGVVELKESFLITFMEAPMPIANVAMEEWAKSIKISD